MHIKRTLLALGVAAAILAGCNAAKADELIVDATLAPQTCMTNPPVPCNVAPKHYDALAAITAANADLHTRSATLSDLRKAEAGALWALHVASFRDWTYTELDSHGPLYLCSAYRWSVDPLPGQPCHWSEADKLWSHVVGTKWSFPAFAGIQTGLHIIGLKLCDSSASTCRIALGATATGIGIEVYLGTKGQYIHHAMNVAPVTNYVPPPQ